MTRFDLDPSLPKAIIIGILIFLVTILTPLVADVQLTGELPTAIHLYTIFLTAVLNLVLYLLAFVKTGEIPEGEK